MILFYFFTIGHVLTKDCTFSSSVCVGFFHPILESCLFCEIFLCHFQLDLIWREESWYHSYCVLCCVAKNYKELQVVYAVMSAHSHYY